MDELTESLLAVDPGDKRVGVAAVGPLGIVKPVATLDAHPRAAMLVRLAELASDRDAVGIVVGLPLNMDGTEGPAARAARALGEEIVQATGLRVVFHDERLTSIDASQRLGALGLTRAQRKQRLDAVAAAAILEGYLASRAHGTA